MHPRLLMIPPGSRAIVEANLEAPQLEDDGAAPPVKHVDPGAVDPTGKAGDGEQGLAAPLLAEAEAAATGATATSTSTEHDEMLAGGPAVDFEAVVTMQMPKYGYTFIYRDTKGHYFLSPVKIESPDAEAWFSIPIAALHNLKQDGHIQLKKASVAHAGFDHAVLSMVIGLGSGFTWMAMKTIENQPAIAFSVASTAALAQVLYDITQNGFPKDQEQLLEIISNAAILFFKVIVSTLGWMTTNNLVSGPIGEYFKDSRALEVAMQALAVGLGDATATTFASMLLGAVETKHSHSAYDSLKALAETTPADMSAQLRAAKDAEGNLFLNGDNLTLFFSCLFGGGAWKVMDLVVPDTMPGGLIIKAACNAVAVGLGFEGPHQVSKLVRGKGPGYKVPAAPKIRSCTDCCASMFPGCYRAKASEGMRRRAGAGQRATATR